MTFTILVILAAGTLPYLLLLLTAIPSKTALVRYGPSWDNRDVRGSAERLSGWRRRAHAAHLNGMEAFPPFAAAMILSLMANASMASVRPLALGFLAFRVLFSAAYIGDRWILRSSTWFGGIFCLLGLFGVALAAS